MDLQVSSLVASDVDGLTEVILYDENGSVKFRILVVAGGWILESFSCPVDPKVAEAFQHNFSGKIRAKIKFVGFPDGTRIYYKGLVQPCFGKCDIVVGAHYPILSLFIP